MKREIKFRGKRIGFDNWLYFDMSHYLSDDSGVPPDFLQYQLDLKTIGQFTGFKDIKGVDIYEGDILKGGIYLEYEVKWDFEDNGWNIKNEYNIKTNFKIIGNIHTTPELLNP